MSGLSGEEVDRRIVIDLTITEYEDGRRVNEAKLHREGVSDYLTTAQRVIAAMATEPEA